MSEHTQYTVAFVPVVVHRGPMEAIHKEALPTDVPVLEAMYGEGSVERLVVERHAKGGAMTVTPASEWERLMLRYGTGNDQAQSWVAMAYGTARGPLLEAELKAAAAETPRILRSARKAAALNGIAARQSADVKQTPGTTTADDDSAQSELEGAEDGKTNTRPTHRDQLVAMLEERELKVRVRDSVPHLEAMATIVDDLEQLGATPAPGANLEGLTQQLDAVRAVAREGADSAQEELDAAAG